ncbi:aspartate carbamoyltransferase [Boudabousia liubingyangii]|uniref:Aspartate carbamoyltransferase n=1 Tax=Boudabousia liubingyangii TaxID=1921764 RepID=A0A1Q5PNM6_9ACTO|nr:aspartate carbamoyltransferase catalytic subunit [Boudabousia liubingyangii]OKL49109.1 aspartate carbamoyltransferase [Boudabousia liubingyangii]
MKNLLTLSGISNSEAITLLDRVQNMKTKFGTPDFEPTLAGATVANLFFEDSTRTRLSFSLAAERLGARVVNFSAAGSSLSKGESLRDTVATITSMGIDAVVIRHQAVGAGQLVAKWTGLPVLNGGDGAHQHPTQALLDAVSLREYLHESPLGKDLAGTKLLIVGDLLHSRVVRSNVDLMVALGAEVTLVGPSTLLPPGVHTWPVKVTTDFDAAIATQPDAVMMLRVQKERMSSAGGGYFPSVGDYIRQYCLNPERYEKLGEKCAILHPGPLNRGLEICDQAADGPGSLILKQVNNGVFVRMAMLDLLINGDEN